MDPQPCPRVNRALPPSILPACPADGQRALWGVLRWGEKPGCVVTLEELMGASWEGGLGPAGCESFKDLSSQQKLFWPHEFGVSELSLCVCVCVCALFIIFLRIFTFFSKHIFCSLSYFHMYMYLFFFNPFPMYVGS